MLMLDVTSKAVWMLPCHPNCTSRQPRCVLQPYHPPPPSWRSFGRLINAGGRANRLPSRLQTACRLAAGRANGIKTHEGDDDVGWLGEGESKAPERAIYYNWKAWPAAEGKEKEERDACLPEMDQADKSEGRG